MVDAQRKGTPMRTDTVAQRLATLVQARQNCAKSGNTEWHARHGERAEALVRERMPSGSGFDNGTTLDLDRSSGDKLVFVTSFHHMDESGGYAGWTDHTVTARASFIHDVALAISGRDRNQIKDLIHDAFHHALTLPAPADRADD
jgi:hypothetical protein